MECGKYRHNMGEMDPWQRLGVPIYEVSTGDRVGQHKHKIMWRRIKVVIRGTWKNLFYVTAAVKVINDRPKYYGNLISATASIFSLVSSFRIKNIC